MSNTDTLTRPHDRLHAHLRFPWTAVGLTRIIAVADYVDAPDELLDQLARFVRPLGWRTEVHTVCPHCDRDTTEVTFDCNYDDLDCDECLAEAYADDCGEYDGGW